MPIDITKIRLAEFIPTEFAVRGSSTAQLLTESGIATQFQVSQDVNFTTALAQNRVGVELRILVEIVTDDSAEPVGSGGTFALAFGFFIENLAELLIPVPATANESPSLEGQVPRPQLLVLLTSIAYSTARGVLWTRLAGTALEGFTLPIVDMNQFLQDVALAKVEAEQMATGAGK